ncbi:hypothetical protein CHH61_03540 [Shouchella clausii]|uniref:Uncharacterized protein n=2 Tax=Shouchella clausii TaxID=79880 RepID=A0A268S4G4_SHOCL|nr:hypothetical protein CHH61_03540 [Shouchella clausii]
MLRDIPKIYLLMFGFLMTLSLLIVWYINAFQRDADTLQLNDAILSATVSEVDQTSRLYEGALLLSETFEPTIWERLVTIYNEGDSVQFDYMFDAEDDRFDNVESDTVSSPTYIIGGKEEDIPQLGRVTYMTGRPVTSIRVKVHEKGDKVGNWTYTSTVAIDAVSKSINE